VVMAFGSVVMGQKVYADSCHCSLTSCPSCQLGYPGGCSGGYTTCTSSDTCAYNGCIHSTGHWTVSGCGTYGFGYRECWDCKNVQCSVCTCISDCTCCGCMRPADVAAELAKLRSR
jgi:hypothetical protein